jgi:hypothetical protein
MYASKVLLILGLKSLGFGLLLYILWNDYLAYQVMMVGISFQTMFLISGAIFFIIDPLTYYLRHIYEEQQTTNHLLKSLIAKQIVDVSMVDAPIPAKKDIINVDKTD